MKPAQLSLGLVGCGRLAEAGYLPALQACGRFRLVGVADPDVARRQRVACGAGGVGGSIAEFPDARALLDAVSVDALVLATPAGTHVSDASLAHGAEVAVLVEKPPAPDAPRAAELARVAPRACIGFNRRFDSDAQRIRRSVPARGLLRVDVALSYRRRAWGAYTAREDALGDLGPHLVDWVRWLTSSDIIEVTTADLRPQRAVIGLILTRGRATVKASTSSPYREEIVIQTEAGEVVAKHRAGGAIDGLLARVSSRGSAPSRLVATLAAQLDAFADRIEGGSGGELAGVADGLATMTVLDAARTAGTRGRPVAVGTGAGAGG